MIIRISEQSEVGLMSILENEVDLAGTFDDMTFVQMCKDKAITLLFQKLDCTPCATIRHMKITEDEVSFVVVAELAARARSEAICHGEYPATLKELVASEYHISISKGGVK